MHTVSIIRTARTTITDEDSGWSISGTINGVPFRATLDRNGDTIGDSSDCWLSTKFNPAPGCFRAMVEDVLDAAAAAIDAVEDAEVTPAPHGNEGDFCQEG